MAQERHLFELTVVVAVAQAIETFAVVRLRVKGVVGVEQAATFFERRFDRAEKERIVRRQRSRFCFRVARRRRSRRFVPRVDRQIGNHQPHQAFVFARNRQPPLRIERHCNPRTLARPRRTEQLDLKIGQRLQRLRRRRLLFVERLLPLIVISRLRAFGSVFLGDANARTSDDDQQ